MPRQDPRGLADGALAHTKLLLTLPLAVLAGCAQRPEPSRAVPVPVPVDLGKRAFTYIDKLVAFGPRPAGSKANHDSLAWMQTELERLGLRPVFDRWHDKIENLEFANLVVTIPGRHRDKIVIGCHHDTKRFEGHADPAKNFRFVGANDGASGCAMLLVLAAELVRTKRLATYELVFFDGEESLPVDWNPYRSLFGSRRYVRNYRQQLLNDLSTPLIRAMILLDMVGAASLQIDEDTNSDPVLRRLLADAAKMQGLKSFVFQHKHAVKDDHLPFVESGIPALNIIDLYDNPEWHTAADTIENLSVDSLQVTARIVLQLLPALERHLFASPQR